MAGPSAGQELSSEQAIIGRFNQMRQAINQQWTKMNELEMESAEHDIVIKALEPMEPSRKCYRMVGDVLVERTVGETLPAVKRNRDGLDGVLKALQEQLLKKQEELKEFQAKYKIKMQGQGDEDDAQQQQQQQQQQQGQGQKQQGGKQGSSSGQGVLV